MNCLNLQLHAYQEQINILPQDGYNVIGQYNKDCIVVYQAFNEKIGKWAVKHKRFGGEDYKLNRMSWIKPNFLWMMYRNGWGQKKDQEVTLAIKLKRDAFDTILKQAVHSTFEERVYGNREAWQKAIKNSEVRLQWDPNHDAYGRKVARKAIQLGLRGIILKKYAKEWILNIDDISDFVASQREHVLNGRLDLLEVPLEKVYQVTDIVTYQKLGIDSL